MTEESLLARLSSWVHFINYPTHVVLHHVLTGERWVISSEEAYDLRNYVRFCPVPLSKRSWLERSVLVTPGQDPVVAPSSSAAEAIASKSWNDWYWGVEAESEREYRWLGWPIIKMPDDLFMLQEILHDTGAASVLEIGHGHGGALWFFAGVLSMTRGFGHVVGVDWDPPAAMPPFDRIQDIRVDLVNADAHQSPTVEQVRAIRAAYHLVVIDVDASVAAKLQLLRLWAPLVSMGGTIVLEDMTTPECADPAANVSMELDRFLIDHPSFGILPQARRFPAGKSTRAVYRRYR